MKYACLHPMIRTAGAFMMASQWIKLTRRFTQKRKFSWIIYDFISSTEYRDFKEYVHSFSCNDSEESLSSFKKDKCGPYDSCTVSGRNASNYSHTQNSNNIEHNSYRQFLLYFHDIFMEKSNQNSFQVCFLLLCSREVATTTNKQKKFFLSIFVLFSSRNTISKYT